ncbi:mating factor a2.3 [Sporisorium reilianum SRZ2]|uniref:Mating factor a2.3 n=2 Tax=Sporisorium reilianum TaxID=72558 RepID=E6ZV69_SPORE|nr:mating factor a1.3 [Sporisorium reilianum]CAI59754.1 mating factor a2.3 [Sporisorium reilianum]CBQ71126.1 mating factor a2.3 [Sporisorium reilianum SRZ2]
MDALTLFAPVSLGAVATEQAPVDEERPNRQTFPWIGCVVA